MSSFLALRTVKTCQIILAREFLGSFRSNYGMRTRWPFFSFALHLILGGKLNICGRDDGPVCGRDDLQKTCPPFAQ